MNSGYLADRVNLRYFLAVGSILCAIANFLLGLANILQIHSYAYFLVVQVFSYESLHIFKAND